MSGLWIALRSLFLRGRVEREIDEEMRFHLDMQTDALMAGGMSREAARRKAMKAFGGLERQKEEYRDILGTRFIVDAWRDFKVMMRRIKDQKAYSITVICMYAIGIGVTATIFSLFNSFVLNPLPFEESERLAVLKERNLDLGYSQFSVSKPNFIDWRASLETFEALTATKSSRAALGSVGESGGATSVRVIEATAGFFDVYKLEVKWGRPFSENEDVVGKDDVVLISYDLWNSRYNQSEDILGGLIVLDGVSRRVIGVMPQWVDRLWRVDVLVPLAPVYENRTDHRLEVIGRMKPNISYEQAEADLQSVAASIRAEYPKEMKGWDAYINPLKVELYGNTRDQSIILLIAVGLLMLIICLNVSGMNLAQSTKRIHEVAIQVSLGASRMRILRQLVLENLALSLFGVCISIPVAVYGMELATEFISGNLIAFAQPSIDGHTYFVMGLVAVVASVLGGALPMVQIFRNDQQEALKSGGRLSTVGRNRLFQALIVGEIAIAMTVVVGATLLYQSFQTLLDEPLGFETENRIVARVNMPTRLYPNNSDRKAYFEAIQRKAVECPNIETAAWTNGMPFVGGDTTNQVRSAEASNLEPGEEVAARWRIVSPGYFDLMKIPLLQGREMEQADEGLDQGVAVISKSLAQRIWGDRNPVGLKLKYWTSRSDYTVVGVVDDNRWYWSEENKYAVYVSQLQHNWWLSMSLTAEYKGDGLLAQRALVEAFAAVDSSLPPSDFISMEGRMAGSRNGYLGPMVVMSIFAGLALLLSVSGVYGLVAFIVSRQKREIGIRYSLGAVKRDIVRTYIMRSLRLGLVGVGIGIVGAMAFTRSLEALLFEMDIHLFPVYVGVGAILMLAVGLATYVPLKRGTRGDLVADLRAE